VVFTVQLTIYGTPVPKGRARVTTVGGHARAYTPKATAAWEAEIRRQAAQQYSGPPLDYALSVTAIFYLPRPKTCKRCVPSVRPDLDNYIKALTDALNDVLWKDDGQIVSVTAEKRYGEPRVEVSVDDVRTLEVGK
jgi:Holliday junction resolvase RusA-like endonuclease